MKQLPLFILVLFLMGPNLISAQIYTVESGSAFFKAKMPLNSYTGKSDQLYGTIDFKTGVMDFSVPLNSIETGIEKRNKHMYELLNSEQYPTVTFKGILRKIPNRTLQTKQAIMADGDFALAGTTQKVTISMDFTPEEKGLKMTASWSVLITDYNLERPSFMFIKVKDKHDLSVDALLKEK